MTAAPTRPWISQPGVRPYIGTVAVDSAASAGMLVALAWVVAHTAGPSWTTALIFGLESIPRAVLVIAGGALADRWGLLRTASSTLTVRLVLMAVFALALYLDGATQLWVLATVALLFGLADALHLPAVEGLRGYLIRDEDGQTALTGTIGSVTQIVEVAAAPLAGFLAALQGGVVGWVLCGLLLSAWVGMRVVVAAASSDVRPSDEEATSGGGLFSEISDGVRLVLKDRSKAMILLVLTVGNGVGTAPLVAGIPLKAREFGWSGAVFGIATLGFALGGAVGAAAAARWGNRHPRSAYLLMLFAALCFAMLAIARAPVAVTAAAALAGIACSFAAQVLIAKLTTSTPTTHLGRVMSLLQVSFYGGVPIGYAVYGVLVAQGGISTAGMLMSGALAAVAVAAFLLPSSSSSTVPEYD